MRGLVLAAAVAAGLLAGAGAMLAASSTASHPAAEPGPRQPAEGPPGTKAVPVPAPDEEVLLVWAAGGLPLSLADAIGAVPQVTATTVVRGDIVELAGATDAAGQAVEELGEGFVIPLDAVAVDVASMVRFLPKSAVGLVADLGQSEAVLSTTGAALRNLGAGGRLSLSDGSTLDVVGVLDDALIGAAEVAVSVPTGRAIGVVSERYVLVQHRGERAAVEQAIREAAPGAELRIRGPGETPVFRHGDAVLPQALIKERFGEFSYRPGAGRGVEQDPAWVEEHIVTAEVPILGAVRCHRAVVAAVEGALTELAEGNLAWLVDPDGYAGCHAARLTSSRQSVSRHSWGIALDLNFPKNPVGQAGMQDPRLLEIMERWGFTWGGEWLVPDPAHFEYLRPPDVGA